MDVHKINEFDIIIEDRVKQLIRITYFNRSETYKPISYEVKYGKSFTEQFAELIYYRTTDTFINDFKGYCEIHNVFQEELKLIKYIETEIEKKTKGLERTKTKETEV